MADTFHIIQNDLLPDLEAVLKAQDAAVDLTGATVNFQLKDSSGKEIFDKAAVVETAASGEVRYEWSDDDTEDAGFFRGRFKVTFSSGKERSFPNPGYVTVVIHGDIDE